MTPAPASETRYYQSSEFGHACYSLSGQSVTRYSTVFPDGRPAWFVRPDSFANTTLYRAIDAERFAAIRAAWKEGK